MGQALQLNLSASACVCGNVFTRPVRVWPLRCVCGRIYQRGEICIGRHKRQAASARLEFGGRCGVLIQRSQPGYLLHRRGLPRKQTVCPKDHWGREHDLDQRLEICHACEHYLHRQQSTASARVGFLAVSYMQIGGTETWHQTLLPRLEGCGGFVCMNPNLAQGDFTKLGVPWGHGLQAAIQLARSVDVLVVWGIGRDLEKILDGCRERAPKVISVSHCDDRSQWTIDMMAEQGPYTDHCVYLCPTGINTVPERLRDRATLIPNGPDSSRIVAGDSRENTRRWLGIGNRDKLMLVTSRLSPEKRIGLLMQAVELLGDGWQLRVAGNAAGWSAAHAKDLESLQTPRVRIIAPVETPGDLLAASDAVLSASEFEGYGLASAEAMLAGVPVISTRTGLLEHHPDLARLVDHDAGAQQWAAAIRDDFADESQQRERAARAQAVMTSDHSADRFASRWSELIDYIRDSRSDFFASNSA